MFSQIANVTLNAPQTIAATQLLLRVAQVDGASTREETLLIREFYEASRNNASAWPDFSALQETRQHPCPDGMFPEAAQRDLVIATCLLVAYADGSLIAEERATILAIAAEIGTPATRVDELLAQVKDTMLAQLARLPDAASVAAVARELG